MNAKNCIIALIVYTIISVIPVFKPKAAADSIAAPNEVIVYEHIDYVGRQRAWRIAPGNQFLYVPHVGDDLNDRISSIHVGSNVHVWLFKDAFFSGVPFDCMAQRIDKSVENLHKSYPNCADTVSSLIIGLKGAGDPIGIDLEDNAEFPFYNTFIPIATTNINQSSAVECVNLKKVTQVFGKTIYQNVDRVNIYPYSASSRLTEKGYFSNFQNTPDNKRKVSITVFDSLNCTGGSITIPGSGSKKLSFDLGKYGFNDRAASLRIAYTYSGQKQGPKWTGGYPPAPSVSGKPEPVGGNRRAPASGEPDKVTASGGLKGKGLEGRSNVQRPKNSIMDLARTFENNTARANIPESKTVDNYTSIVNTNPSMFKSSGKHEPDNSNLKKKRSPHPVPPGNFGNTEDVIPETHLPKEDDSIIPDISFPSREKVVRKNKVQNIPHNQSATRVVKAPEIGRDIHKGASVSGNKISMSPNLPQINSDRTTGKTATISPDVSKTIRGKTVHPETVRRINPPSNTMLKPDLSGKQAATSLQSGRVGVSEKPALSKNTSVYARKTIPVNQGMLTTTRAYTMKKSILSDRELKAGMKGDDVGLLQQSLQRLGFDIPEKELKRKYFGRGTHEVIALMQKRHGLKPTGIVDKRTAALIEEMLEKLKNQR